MIPKRPRAVLALGLFVAFVFPFGLSLERAAAAADPSATRSARIAPSFDGHFGAWLVLGPFESASRNSKATPLPDALGIDPPKLAESSLAPTYPSWHLASTNAGAIDLKAVLKSDPLSQKNDLIAYAAGTLHLEKSETITILLGSDDGIRLSIDGNIALSRDEARPQRDDDDAFRVDLAAGDHPILFKLHQRDGAWSFRARFVDSRFQPPAGAWLTLAGVDAEKEKDLAVRMSRITSALGVRDDGYAIRVQTRFSEGAPIGIPLRVRASVQVSGQKLFEVDAGEVSLAAPELEVQLPLISREDLARIEDHDLQLHVEVAGHAFDQTFHPRKNIREAIVRADVQLRRFENAARPTWLKEDSLESLQNARNRLVFALDHADSDLEALSAETRELGAIAEALERDHDPYLGRSGAIRMAYRSPVDGGLSEYGLYVPASYRPGSARRYPLVVALHGMNGKPMAMMRWFFGEDDPKRDQDYEDRHFDSLAPLDAFVVTPDAHGNTMYRDLGEDDPLRVLDRIRARFPIDDNRITITGPSMGGIGAASIPFRHPDRFAAAAPLCGYHSYFVRRDIAGRTKRPWEVLLAEERSNANWAENGWGLPLLVVHGTRDLPLANSGVLIDAYKKLNFSIEEEHPDLGHNVWQTTYENFKGARWLLDKRRDPSPRRVRFRTLRLRDGKSYWVRLSELSAPDVWGSIDARIQSRTAIVASTANITEVAFERDPALVDPSAAITITLDGHPISFPAATALVAHRAGMTWISGPSTHDRIWKRGEITGPIRDVFHAPILFVWGSSDPEQARVNEAVARSFAAIRAGVSVDYPILSDTEFYARGEKLESDRALFLVGNAKSNRVVAALEGELPIQIDRDEIVIGRERVRGEETGAVFIWPNPRRTDRYLVVVEGTSALGTLRALSLPDLLPDFAVWDKTLAPARGQMLLSAGALRAGGFFKNDWTLPDRIDDPFASANRPAAKTEYEATPYLP